MAYTDEKRTNDFNYFVNSYRALFEQYGHCFLAIKDKKVIGNANTIPKLIEQVSAICDIGEYIIQECKEDDSAYTTRIMRLMIHAW